MIKTNNAGEFITIFDSITEMVNYCKVTKQGKYFTGHSSRTGSHSFCHTETLEEANELSKTGWQEGYELLRKHEHTVKVNPTAADRKHYERINVEGFVPCVPRAIEGHPESMFNAIKIPYKHRVLNFVINISASCSYTTEEFIKRATFTAQMIDVIENKGYRINLYVGEGARNGGETSVIMTKIKSSTEQLSLKRMVYPIGHPSLLRRHYFKVLESLDVDEDWSCGYGRPDDECIKKYCKRTYDAFLFVPSLNAIGVRSNDYQDYLKKVFDYNDFKLT